MCYGNEHASHGNYSAYSVRQEWRIWLAGAHYNVPGDLRQMSTRLWGISVEKKNSRTNEIHTSSNSSKIVMGIRSQMTAIDAYSWRVHRFRNTSARLWFTHASVNKFLQALEIKKGVLVDKEKLRLAGKSLLNKDNSKWLCVSW